MITTGVIGHCQVIWKTVYGIDLVHFIIFTALLIYDRHQCMLRSTSTFFATNSDSRADVNLFCAFQGLIFIGDKNEA